MFHHVSSKILTHDLRPLTNTFFQQKLITQLDAKSSPLALLAQTCSAIGADTTNPKLLAANIEKSTKSALKSGNMDGRDKSSPVSSQSSSVSTGSVEHIKSSFKPYESNNNLTNNINNNNHMRERLEAETERATNLSTGGASANSLNLIGNGGRVRTPKSNGSGGIMLLNGQQHAAQQLQQQHQHQQQQQQQQQRCDSNQSATSQRDSPATGMNGLRKSSPNGSAGAVIDLQQRISNSSSPQQRASSKESATLSHATSSTQMSPSAAAAAAAAASQSRLQSATDSAIAAAKEANYVKALHAAAAAAGVPTTSAGSLSGSSSYYAGYPGASPSSGLPYPMDVMTASALMSQHHPMFKAAALHPYLNYARLKGIDPATMMTPNICRDPYCTGCPSSPHFLNKAAGQPCPAGCPQCEGGVGKTSALGGGGSSAAAAVAAAAASSYHAQLAALAAASQMPYVCSWISADAAYCGKRFGTSDELFQHLRTHTASLPDSVLSAAAAGGIPPTHPLFQRTYPTPPLSPLSAARYHPYGKPSMLPPPLASAAGALGGLPMPPHPALAQYFAPYSLYGPPRMGSSHP
ncbi:zinc finger protein Elbow [Ceratitis capitata]|uniref:zinc finger protein Elbow n=1 Tax=Ceratitis capitata TaxID=7213 RepID=UPI000C6C7797|nr:zinc finger protein Elbow [Ceratitis capitata]